ncbi:hypothetical protein PC9H_006119 [Pleurotus ostreatus]|uniref:Uncharacterized protein n=1 Tax=Pleurotus ostreatus TaxID=5322 RepID=A0A8H7DTT3_PLEOS|nr:uncharacterized protein PC9H_006119 [Pleurotus ostreatus]KAF7430414.1 hypothetical protein PC9H_006119 [Pleurotus ostreatus]
MTPSEFAQPANIADSSQPGGNISSFFPMVVIVGKDVSVIHQLDWDGVSLLNSAIDMLLEGCSAYVPQYLIFALEPLADFQDTLAIIMEWKPPTITSIQFPAQ